MRRAITEETTEEIKQRYKNGALRAHLALEFQGGWYAVQKVLGFQKNQQPPSRRRGLKRKKSSTAKHIELANEALQAVHQELLVCDPEKERMNQIRHHIIALTQLIPNLIGFDRQGANVNVRVSHEFQLGLKGE